MSSEECRRFEKKLAFHTAPSLLGIKCASLLTLSRSEFDISGNARRFNRRAAAKGLKIKVLREECACRDRSLILVYNEGKLAERLSCKEARELLSEYGYAESMSLEQALERLSQRAARDEFPHEIGIFLDYPVEDVRGFVQNSGCNYKLCGCWKVYGDEKKARELFARFKKCTEIYCALWEAGSGIEQLAVAV